MKIVIVLFALFGASLALEPGKQYKYKYEGRIGMGLPDIKNRVAGLGLRCDVGIQSQTEEDAVIQLDNIEVGEYIGDVDCHIQEPMPIKYSPMEGDGKLLSEPFMIHLHKDQDDVMLVPKADVVWITNIRKSIASLFLIEPLRDNVVPGLKQIPYHKTKEPSIFGLCDADYSLIQVNDTQQPQPRDQQRNQTYAMTRDINFDSCRDLVVLQQTGVGNTTVAKENLYHDVSTRSSRMAANLTYDGHRYVLRNSSNQGYVIVNPFGLDHDKLMAITNQTIFLVSTQQIGDKWKVPEPSKSVVTWYQESVTPYEKSDQSPLWVNFYNENDPVLRPFLEESLSTGIEITDKDIDDFKKKLDDRMTKIADLLQKVGAPPQQHKINPMDSDAAKLASNLESAFRLVRTLDYQRIEQLYDQYIQDKTDRGQLKARLFVDVMSVSGSGAALKVIVDESVDKKRITPERAASVFFSLPNTLYSTPVISELERYVKSLTLDQNPFATATVWINHATIVNKYCINDKRYRFSAPHDLFGKQECNPKTATDSILSFFQSQLERADQDWKRIILIQAIGNLGTIQANTLLTNIVKDRSQNDTVRVTAVYGLSRYRLPEGVRDHVFRTLMPVVISQDENEYVRQACIIALLSWKPSPSFFQGLAVSTWSERSDNMASFIYFILQSYAQSTDPAIDRQSKVAKFAVTIAKRYAPSYRYAQSRSYSRYTQQDQLATDFDVSWLKRDRSGNSYTEQIFSFLTNSFGGFRFSVAQLSLSFNQQSFNTLLRKMSLGQSQNWRNARSPSDRRAQQELVKLQDRMSQRVKSEDDQFSIFFMSLFDNMEVLLPLSQDSLTKAFGDHGPKSILDWMKDGHFHGTKFINPGLISLVIPSEMGVPVSVRVSMPTINYGEADVILQVDGQNATEISQLLTAKDIRFTARSNYKFTTKTITMIRALLPWSRRAAVAGVESLKSIELPAEVRLDIDKRNSPMTNVSLAVIPTFNNDWALAQFHTVPFVALKQMWPGSDMQPKTKDSPQGKDVYQVVSLRGDFQGTVERESKINVSYTGVNGKMWYEGDVANPWTLGNILDLARRPEEIPSLFGSPTCRMSESTIIPNIGQSKTKELHASFAFQWGNNQPSRKQQQKAVFPGPKLQRPALIDIETNLLLNGTETRYFECSAKVSHTEENQKEHTEVVLVHARSPLPNFDSKPKAYCLDVKREGPLIKTNDDLRNVLKKAIEADYTGQLKGGVSCEDKDIADIKATFKVSEDRRQRLQKEFDQDCSSDPHNPVTVFETAPVYDVASLDITYQEPVPRDVLNASYHVYDCMRGWAFPHVYFNYMDQEKNSHGKISVQGNRYVGERRWEIQAKLPTEQVSFDQFQMPKPLENIIPAGGLSSTPERFDTPSLVAESQLSNQCVITKSKVRAFDGFSYNFPSEYCDTQAVGNREDKHAPVFMSSLDGETQNLKGLIGSLETGTTIVFTKKMMLVDSKEIGLTREPTVLKAPGGIYLAEALKTSTYTEVRIPGNFTVRLEDNKITITPSANLRNRAGGLCGDFNGATHMELIGKENCIYQDPKLFAQSWAEYSGVGCDYQKYKKEQEAVEKFRKHCPKLPEPRKQTSVLPKYSPVPSDCIEYVYKIHRNDGALCVTQDVVAICYPLCKLDKPRIYDEVYDCWPEPFAPRELARYEKRGYIRHKVPRRAYVLSSFKTEHAYMCSRK